MYFTAKYFEELTTKELYEILKARAEIFIMEQNIHYQDMDDLDYDSLHCFFMEDNRVIAYLRAFFPETDYAIVKVGRVLTLRHGCGIGKELMVQSIKAVKEKTNCRKICINAQKYAEDFYKKFGFRTVSGDFLEAGIVHVAMVLEV